MWLLDTARAELHYFVSPEKVPDPGYAILSHVWRKVEQSFQDVKAIGEQCKLSGENPRDKVCEKIRRCCEVAEEEGHKWVWIDTCCIDKSSSAELSEAINSMFRYYTLAVVCFIYVDLPPWDDVKVESDFELQMRSERRRARTANDVHLWQGGEISYWASRGWTLQELIAPTVAILLSPSWTLIGSKHDLADELERVTQVPASLLRHETRLSDYSVAQRMSWAAHRNTTRIEDEAYCLLGIFDINMPTLYGEGRRAFRRLQEEIMRTRLDTSLFAWGGGKDGPKDLMEALGDDTADFTFLARCPNDFSGLSYVGSSPDSAGPEASTIFTVTPHGILARVPLLYISGKTFIDLSCRTLGHHRIFLRVEQTKGGIYAVVGRSLGYRIFINKDRRLLPSGELKEIYLANGSSDPGPSSRTMRSIAFPCNSSARTPFHFSIVSSPEGKFKMKTAENVERDWTGNPPAVIQLSYTWRDPKRMPRYALRTFQCLVICGVCTAQTPHAEKQPEPRPYVHWARTQWFYDGPPGWYSLFGTPGAIWWLCDGVPVSPASKSALNIHDCTKDHVADWADLRKNFRAHDQNDKPLEWGAELSFIKTRMYPEILTLRSVTVQDCPGESTATRDAAPSPYDVDAIDALWSPVPCLDLAATSTSNDTPTP